MAKKRKTRKQKMLSDLRHQALVNNETSSEEVVSSSLPNTAPTYSFISPSIVTSNVPSTHSTTYAYVIHDLRKTALLTGAIVIAELILHFGLKAF